VYINYAFLQLLRAKRETVSTSFLLKDDQNPTLLAALLTLYKVAAEVARNQRKKRPFRLIS
jgi:hypothetical protein